MVAANLKHIVFFCVCFFESFSVFLLTKSTYERQQAKVERRSPKRQSNRHNRFMRGKSVGRILIIYEEGRVSRGVANIQKQFQQIKKSIHLKGLRPLLN